MIPCSERGGHGENPLSCSRRLRASLHRGSQVMAADLCTAREGIVSLGLEISDIRDADRRAIASRYSYKVRWRCSDAPQAKIGPNGTVGNAVRAALNASLATGPP